MKDYSPEELKGKIAVVTGAGRGIGRATAHALAREGVHCVLCARTRTELDETAGEIRNIGAQAHVLVADLSRESDCSNVVEEAVRRFSRIDILVNNAGVGSFARVEELRTEDFDRMWQVNMRGVFLTTRAAIPHMRKQGAGDIVNIASLAGRNAFIGGTGYAATKWALIGFSRSLMLEVRESNIRVITICPGSVDTSFGGSQAEIPKSTGSIPQAADIAHLIVDTLRMPRHVMVSEVDIRPTNPRK